MRILSLVFSLVVAISLMAMALIYLGERVGQQRIYVQDEWLSSDDVQAYRAYGDPKQTSPDTAKVALGDTGSYRRR